MQSAYWLFLVFFIILITLQINFKVKFSFNAIENLGKIKIDCFGIILYKVNFKIHKDCIELHNKNKIELVPLDFNSEQFIEFTDFPTLIIKKTLLKRLMIYANVGLNDAYYSCMFASFLQIVSYIAQNIIKTKKQEVQIYNKIYPNFKKNELIVCVKTFASISIFDFLWACGTALVNKYYIR